MKSTVETLDPTRVRLLVEVAPPELEPSREKAYRTLASQIRVKGFRPGRVPPRLVEQQVGRAAVLSEAVNDALPKFYSEAVQEHDIKVLGQPDVEVTVMSEDEGLAFTAEVDVRPEIKLPAYESITVTIDDTTVSDAEVDEQLESLRERFSVLRTVERPAATGDYVAIDLDAAIDGEPVSGGSTKGMSYEVGSDTLVPGLDEAVTGLSAGESAEFESTLFGEQDGNAAVVTVTVRSVKEKDLPDLDDEFAQTASEFDTIDELRQDVADRMRRTGRMQQAVEARDKILATLVEAVDVPLPKGLLEHEIEHRRESVIADLETSGTLLERYLETSGQTEDEFEGELREASERAVRNMLVLDAVADAEEVAVGDAEVSEVIVRRAINSGIAPDEFIRRVIEAGNLPVIVGEARRGKAFSIVMEQAVVIDGDGNRVDLDALVASVSTGRTVAGAAESDAEVVDADVEVEGPDDTAESAESASDSEVVAPAP